MSTDKLKNIIDNNLCVRCGTCAGVCPVNSITFDENKYPANNSLCIDCDHCLDVCPGINVNFPEMTKQLFRKEFKIGQVLGFFSNVYAGYALDPEVRLNASSGGIITQLLIYLLEKKIIDGAIVTIMDPNAPWESKAIIAKTKDEILKSIQSRYTVVPVNKVFNELRKIEGKFALVGLPCHIHGFRKLANIDPSVSDKIFLVLGLFCHMTLEQKATLDLAKISGIPQNEIKKLEYRGGEWPGGIRIEKKNGNIQKLHYSNIKDGAFNYLSRLYYPKRCLYCIDGSGEFADISFADPWLKSTNKERLFRGGWTLIFVRTELGEKFLAEAEKDKAIFHQKLSEKSVFDNFSHNKMIKNKRKMALTRLSRLKSKNRPAPNYYLEIPSISLKYQFKECLFSLTLIFIKFERIRELIMMVIFSRIGILLIKLRLFFKNI